MTSQEILNVARVVAKYLEEDVNQDMFPENWYDFTLTPEDEQTILDIYYSQHGIYEADAVSEQDWYEVAEKIR